VRARRMDGTSTLLEQLRNLDSCGKAYAVLFCITSIFFLLLAPGVLCTAILSTGLPFYFIYKWWRRNQTECTFGYIFSGFGMGFFVLSTSILWTSFAWLVIASNVLDKLFAMGAFDGASARGVTFLVYLILLVPFVFVEEGLKASFIRMRKHLVTVETETKAHLMHATAVSTGYASAQALFWTLVAHGSMSTTSSKYVNSFELQLAFSFLIAFCVTCVGTPLLVLAGYLIGLETTRGTGLLDSIKWPTYLRSFYYLSAIGWLLVLPGLWGLVPFILTNVAVSFCMVRRIKSVERDMPIEYLRRVGYLALGGYGVLDEDDHDHQNQGDIDESEVDTRGLETQHFGMKDSGAVDLRSRVKGHVDAMTDPRSEEISAESFSIEMV